MKKLLSLVFLVLACASTNANAWFFFFFPIPLMRGSGDTCVAASAKAGDTFRSPNGNVATIKSTSGDSSRCRLPDKPNLAVVEFVMSTSFTPKAGMKLPDGYTPQSLTDLQRFNGMLLLAKDSYKDAGVIVASTKREVISDLETYAANLRANQTRSLDDVTQTEVEHLTINGIKAWRFETKGKLKNLFGSRYTYLMTVLEGDQEVVSINAWTSTGNYETQKEELKQLAANVTGIQAAPAVAESALSPPSPARGPMVSSDPAETAALATPQTALSATPAATTTATQNAGPVAQNSAYSLEQFKARHPDSVFDQEPPMGTLRQAEIVYVNDKSCADGQIREVTGGSPNRGIDRKYRCISLAQ